MTKKEFQELHGFDDADMDKLSTIIKTFNGTITKIQTQDEYKKEMERKPKWNTYQR